jgi:uncharacterized protein YukE
MTDATLLGQHLSQFDDALRQHLQLVSDEFRHLQQSWDELRDCYEGVGAERFEAVWTGTVRRFEDYLQQSEALRSVLRERLEALERFDQPGI